MKYAAVACLLATANAAYNYDDNGANWLDEADYANCKVAGGSPIDLKKADTS